MAELIKTRCTQGWLFITEEAIIVELPGILGSTIKSETLLRSAFVRLEAKPVAAGLFSKKPAMHFTFYGQDGRVLRADLVKGGDAQKIIMLLTGRV